MAPSLNPEDWFLADRGNPDTQISNFTLKNEVRFLVDGKEYMETLYDLLITAGAGDYFYFAGWELDPELNLVRLDPASTDTIEEYSIGYVLKKAKERGVDIRLLLSGHLTHGNDDAADFFEDEEIECILDNRFRYPVGSAHQKFCVLLTDRANGPASGRLPKKELFAFCGGIDLTTDRWDDSTHDQNRRFQEADYPGGWHDVTTLIRGPACTDLHITFHERWNNPEWPRWNDWDVHPIPVAILESENPPAGTHCVQVLRTYPCGYTSTRRVVKKVIVKQVSRLLSHLVKTRVTFPFARNGEFSARHACLKAIGQAQDFIYIEEQYFFSQEIAAALADRLVSQADLRVIVVVTREPAADPAPQWENYFHARTIRLIEQRIEGTVGEGHFAIYDLGIDDPDIEQIYVHAKLMIVDDIWVQIGSMNCNRRSMTHDLECCVAVVDESVETVTYGSYLQACTFARKLRKRLWSEHLEIAPTDPRIDDPQAAFEVWVDISANNKVTRLGRHLAAADRWPGLGAWSTGGDPQGTCAGEPEIPDP